jgi:ABC-type amino acid transport substrate-binding protein
MPDGDPLLHNLLQNFLATLAGSGDLKKMTERWFKDASWLKELP